MHANFTSVFWVVATQIFLFSPRSLGKWSTLTNIFQMGWNHQPVLLDDVKFFFRWCQTYRKKSSVTTSIHQVWKDLCGHFFGELLLFIELLEFIIKHFAGEIPSSPGKNQPSFAKTKQTKRELRVVCPKKDGGFRWFSMYQQLFLVPLIGGIGDI